MSALRGTKKVIWLKNGPPEDDFRQVFPGIIYPFGTGGHVDEFCRFANANTILLAEVSEEDRKKGWMYEENYKRMEENFKILKDITDQNGNPYKIIRMPSPDLIINEMLYENIGKGDLLWFPSANVGDTLKIALATSYLNFITTDKIVIGAKYWKPGMNASLKKKDEEVFSILKNVFPQHEVLQIDPVTINHGGGGFHCFTYNEPKIN